MNPYADLPKQHFWKAAVSGIHPDDVDPLIDVPFTIGRDEKIAAAGSCFAQHISRFLSQQGYNYLITEGTAGDRYGPFPARFGNIYTVRQLLQLFRRTYGVFRPTVRAWKAENRFVDPFRPQIPEGGYDSEAAVESAMESHLSAVKRMFKQADILIFTLGLTEAWECAADGAVVPVPPGVIGAEEQQDAYRFRNFSVSEMEADLTAFVTALRTVNPTIRLILTVSPVPLVASYRGHVLTATTYSKCALRVLCESAEQNLPGVAYFPSYEIISGAHNKGRFFEDNLRAVREEGVAHVMSIFKRHFLAEGEGSGQMDAPERKRTFVKVEGQELLCDEELLDG
jgi:hypothetical protein